MRLLVIGERGVRESVARMLAGCTVIAAENPLAGVWEAGQNHVDGVLLEVSREPGDRHVRAIRALRQLAPKARIVLACAPADEPAARRAVDHGADGYVLEPLARGEVEAAFGRGTPRIAPAASASETPSPAEIAALGRVMQSLGDGPRPTLAGLADLIRDAFEAEGVLIELDELSTAVGSVERPVVEESIVRQGRRVGRIVLAARRRGHYAAAETARLSHYARLVDAVVQQAQDGERWRKLAWSDDLSGVYNRRYFDRALAELIDQAHARRLRVTVFLFDIDDFKTYNDRYGHAAGDSLIREIGRLLKRCSRERDVVARYGGDEFAVIYWDAEPPRVAGSQHPSDPLQLTERFCAAIRAHHFECLGPGAPGPLTISGGLATFPWDGRTPAELLAAADRALLESKRQGKNRTTLAGADEEVCARRSPADATDADAPSTSADGPRRGPG